MLARPEADTFFDDLSRARNELYSYAVSLTRDGTRAEDLVQETYLRAIRAEATFTRGTKLVAWLITILRNTFYNSYRKRTEEEDPDDTLADLMVSSENPYARLEAWEALQIFATLPVHYQQVLRLVADGLTHREIAAQLGIHENTVKSRVHRGRIVFARLSGSEERLVKLRLEKLPGQRLVKRPIVARGSDGSLRYNRASVPTGAPGSTFDASPPPRGPGKDESPGEAQYGS